MKKTSLLLALVVSISGVSPLLANEVQQQTNQNAEGITQPDQENKATQPNQDNNEPSETKQTPTASNIDWTLPGMQLSDWEYNRSLGVNRTLLRYKGRVSDTVYVPAYFSEDNPYAATILKGNVLEGTTIKNLKIVNFPGNKDTAKKVIYGDATKHDITNIQTLQIPDNSIVSSIEFIGGSGNINFEGSELRAQKNDFIDVKGIEAAQLGLYGNVVKVNELVDGVETDLKYAEYINANAIAVVASGAKRVNPNPLYMQSEYVSYWPSNSIDDRIDLKNHYQLNQLLDGMGIKSEMQLKLDANGGNGGVIIRQPIFFFNSLTGDQQKQLYQNRQDLDACIRIAFLENPTYYPTLEGRTFLGWEKHPTNTRAIADAFNQTYLAKWSELTSQPTVTPTQPNPQPPVQPNNQAPVPTTTVSTASNNQAMVLITVVLIGSIGLLSLRRWR